MSSKAQNEAARERSGNRPAAQPQGTRGGAGGTWGPGRGGPGTYRGPPECQRQCEGAHRAQPAAGKPRGLVSTG